MKVYGSEILVTFFSCDKPGTPEKEVLVIEYTQQGTDKGQVYSKVSVTCQLTYKQKHEGSEITTLVIRNKDGVPVNGAPTDIDKLPLKLATAAVIHGGLLCYLNDLPKETQKNVYQSLADLVKHNGVTEGALILFNGASCFNPDFLPSVGGTQKEN